jgi:hypothetical protein
VFEAEVRVIRRFINQEYEYNELDMERPDYLPQYSAGLRENVDTRIAYSDSTPM